MGEILTIQTNGFCEIQKVEIYFMDCCGCKHCDYTKYATNCFPCGYPNIFEPYHIDYRPVSGGNLTETEMKETKLWIRR